MSENELEPQPAEVLEELRPTPGSRAVSVIVSVVMFLLGAAMLFPMTGQVSFLSLVLAAFFLMGGVHYLRRTLSSKPRVEWDEAGLIDRTSMIGGELEIPWSDVRNVSVSKLNGGIRLELIDHASVYDHLGLGRRIQQALLRLRRVRGIEISPSFLGVDYRVLGATLQQLLLDFEIRSLESPHKTVLTSGQGARATEAGSGTDGGAASGSPTRSGSEA